MKYKLVAIFALICIGLLLSPSRTYADYVAKDHSITGTFNISSANDPMMRSMKMDSQRDPVANSNLQMMLTLEDSQKKFQLKNCDCTLTLVRPNKLPSTQKVTVPNFRAPDTNITMVYYNFPAPSTYTLTLTGKPINNATFTPFTLKWNIKVGGKMVETPKAKHPRNANLWIYIAILAVAIAAFLGWRYYYTRQKNVVGE